jgi:hypothetical protein
LLKSLRNLFENVPFYPLLLGIYPILYLWQANFSEVQSFVIWRSLIISLGVTLVVYLVCLAIIHPPRKSAVVAGLFLFLFFFYGHFVNLLEHVELAGLIIGRHRFMLPFWGVLFAVGLVLVLRTHSDLKSLTSVLNLVCLGLVFISAAQTSFIEVKRMSTSQSASANSPVAASSHQPVVGTSAQQLPDIYYFVLDGYDRQDFLLQDVNLDNRDFIESLQGLGFVIPDCTMSNYNNTLLSMGATLNMNYLDQLGYPYAKQISDPDSSTLGLTSLLLNNLVMEKLRALGYQVITLHSGWPYLDFKNSDIVFDSQADQGFLGKVEALNFQYLFLRTTLWRVVVEASIAAPARFEKIPDAAMQWINPQYNRLNSSSYMVYAEDLYQLDKLDQVVDLPGAKFFYAHLMVTHEPFMVTSTGQFQMDFQHTNPGYADAVSYASSRMLPIIKRILSKSPVLPIIILQGDHGFEQDGRGKDAFKILNAYYLPGDGSSQLYPSITPVNTFRLIFSHYFHDPYPFLPDQSIWLNHTFPGGFQIVPPSCIQ